MSEIFISYASEDKPRAGKLAKVLTKRGWSVWWDHHIQVGHEFSDEIDRRLSAARCVVVLWSDRSVASRWVRAEATDALNRKILIPALIDQVKPPLAFRELNTANLTKWKGDLDDSEIQRLFQSVEKYLPRTRKGQLAGMKGSQAKKAQGVGDGARPQTVESSYAPSSDISLDENLVPLGTMGQIGQMMRQIPTTALYQTFIQGFSPATRCDILLEWLKSDRNPLPEVHRVITLSHPMDVNFAQHSVDLAKKYPGLHTHIVQTQAPFVDIRAYPNLTIWHDEAAMITLPFGKHPFPLAQADSATDSVGLLVRNLEFVKMATNYFQRLTSEFPEARSIGDLEDAKVHFWEKERGEYLLALADSIFKETLAHPELKAQIRSLSVVGSVAKHRADSLRDPEPESQRDQYRDLDIVILFNKFQWHLMKLLRPIVEEVIERFSNADVRFEADYEACPLKPVRPQYDKGVFIVQLLIDDLETVQSWTPPVAYDWYRSAIHRHLAFPDSVKRRGGFDSRTIVEGRYGINDCLLTLVEGRPIVSHMWKQRDGKATYEAGARSLGDDPDTIARFCRYAIYWSSVNYSRATDSTVPSTARTPVLCVEWLTKELALSQNDRLLITNLAANHGQEPIADVETIRRVTVNFLQGFRNYLAAQYPQRNKQRFHEGVVGLTVG